MMAKLKHVPWMTYCLYRQKDKRPYIEENWVPNSLIPVKKIFEQKKLLGQYVKLSWSL